MIMRDRETGTLWQHATGEGLAGPLRGRQLLPLGGEQMTWAAWRSEHPESVVVLEPEQWSGILPRATVEHMLTTATNARTLELPGLHGIDPRLPGHELVAGIVVGGEAKAYPISLLHSHTLINDQVGDRPIALLYEQAPDRVRAFDRVINGHVVALHYQDGNLLGEEDDEQWTSTGNPMGNAGNALTALPVSRQRWMGWSEFHPGGAVYGGEGKQEKE